MRISDWSSDVCSSDLSDQARQPEQGGLSGGAPSRLRLGVNIDHVATIRNARGGEHPDPVRAAEIVAAVGGDGITAHLREDRRHIRDDDLRSEGHTSELQSLMRNSYAVFCLKKKKKN